MLIVEQSLKFWRNVPCPSSGNDCPRSLAAPKSYLRYYWWSVSQSILVYIIITTTTTTTTIIINLPSFHIFPNITPDHWSVPHNFPACSICGTAKIALTLSVAHYHSRPYPCRGWPAILDPLKRKAFLSESWRKVIQGIIFFFSQKHTHCNFRVVYSMHFRWVYSFIIPTKCTTSNTCKY
jgi:hypothetical protein